MTNLSTPTINHISARIQIGELSNSLDFIEDLAKDITSGLSLNILKKVDYKFEPVGRTLVYILSESHMAIHTWPESQTLHIDLVSCSGTKVSDFDRVVAHALRNVKISKYRSETHPV